jgi:hypothetical protein
MLEEYTTNSDGLVVADSTWTYKVPTIDTIPKQFNVEIHNSGHHQKRVLSSKGKLFRVLFLLQEHNGCLYGCKAISFTLPWMNASSWSS